MKPYLIAAISLAALTPANAQDPGIRQIYKSGSGYTIIWNQSGDWTQVTKQGNTLQIYSNGGIENPGTYQPVPIVPNFLGEGNEDPD